MDVKQFISSKREAERSRLQLEKDIIEKTLSEKPVFFHKWSQKVAKELGGAISNTTIKNILKRSGKFKFGYQKIENYNKPVKIFVWN